MIRIFRKVKLSAVIQGKVKRYLLYAFGEILLVVLGILIALYINNRNTLRVNQEIVKSSLREVRKDLLDDIEKAHRNIYDFKESSETYNRFFDTLTPFTESDYRAGQVPLLGFFYYDYIINSYGSNNLFRQEQIISDKYRPILRQLSDLQIKNGIEIQVANERIRKTVYDKIDFLYSQDWYIRQKTGGPISQDEFDYFLNSSDYKLHIMKFMNDRRIVNRNGLRYMVKAIETVELVDSLLDISPTVEERLLLGYVNETDSASLLGTYSYEADTMRLEYSNHRFMLIDNLGIKYRHYKINDSLFMYMTKGRYPIIWSLTQQSDGSKELDLLDSDVLWKQIN